MNDKPVQNPAQPSGTITTNLANRDNSPTIRAKTIISQDKTNQKFEEEIKKLKAENEDLKKKFTAAKDSVSHNIHYQSAIEEYKKQSQTSQEQLASLQKLVDTLKAEKDKMLQQEKEVAKEMSRFLTVKGAKKHPHDPFIPADNLTFPQVKEILIKLQDSELKGQNFQLGEQSDQSEFYDTIINVKSFLKLIRGKGWEITRKKDSKTSLTGAKACVISIVGNYNKGKSWVTSYLSKRKLPFGDNVHTKGISCIYPVDETPILYLDSVGFEEALRLPKLEKYLVDPLNISETDIDKQQKTNVKSDQKLQLLKDKQYTEFFIQQFLLDSAKVIIIVVGQLTFADQKFINRIFAEFKGKKRIFVLHNFSTLFTLKDVERCIKKDIRESFDVEEIRYPQNLGENVNHRYFREKEKEEICHVVFAKDGSEAGSYFNESSKQILVSTISSQAQQNHYLLEDALKHYLKDQFSRYIDSKSASDFDIKLEILENVKSITPDKPEKIKPKEREYMRLISNFAKPIEFKPCNFDDFGYMKVHFSSTTAQVLPYSFYSTSESYILQVEAAGFGKEELKSFKYRKVVEEDGFYLVIEASKKIKKPEKSLMEPTIQFGDVKCQTDKVKFALHQDFGDKSMKEISDGILTIVWPKKKLDLDDEDGF